MFVLHATYLMNRVYSARFDDGDSKSEPEWPPHPSRLFSALTAAWGEGGAEEELRPALEWIEAQTPPAIYAGNCTTRSLVQAFVPVNDSAALPEDRSRKPRSFPSATLDNPNVYFAWNTPIPETLTPALKSILQRTSSIGHSSSLIALEITDHVPDGPWNLWELNLQHGDRMRVPYPGRLNDLVAAYRKFEKNPVKIHRPSLGKTGLYARPLAYLKAPYSSIFDRMIVLKCDEGTKCALPSTLSLLSALRGAILKHSPQPVPEFLSGHAPGSTPGNPIRSDSPHVALAPLANVGNPHATGFLLGAAAILPRTLAAPEQDICWEIMSDIEELRTPWGVWQVSLTDAEEHRHALRPFTWTRQAKVWSTVTPFVFDRYPTDPYGPEAEQVVREAFVRIGLPEPIDLDLHYNPWHLGVPKASAFPPAANRPGKPKRYHCHVRAEFASPVDGPILAGAGRYYGYGFFRPLANTAGGR